MGQSGSSPMKICMSTDSVTEGKTIISPQNGAKVLFELNYQAESFKNHYVDNINILDEGVRVALVYKSHLFQIAASKVLEFIKRQPKEKKYVPLLELVDDYNIEEALLMVRLPSRQDPSANIRTKYNKLYQDLVNYLREQYRMCTGNDTYSTDYDTYIESDGKM